MNGEMGRVMENETNGNEFCFCAVVELGNEDGDINRFVALDFRLDVNDSILALSNGLGLSRDRGTFLRNRLGRSCDIRAVLRNSGRLCICALSIRFGIGLRERKRLSSIECESWRYTLAVVVLPSLPDATDLTVAEPPFVATALLLELTNCSRRSIKHHPHRISRALQTREILTSLHRDVIGNESQEEQTDERLHISELKNNTQ